MHFDFIRACFYVCVINDENWDPELPLCYNASRRYPYMRTKGGEGCRVLPVFLGLLLSQQRAGFVFWLVVYTIVLMWFSNMQLSNRIKKINKDITFVFTWLGSVLILLNFGVSLFSVCSIFDPFLRILRAFPLVQAIKRGFSFLENSAKAELTSLGHKLFHIYD